MNELTFPAISDYHLHARQGVVSSRIIQHSEVRCGRVLVMPNTEPPILTGSDAIAYGKMVSRLAPTVDVLTTIKLTPETTPKMIKEAAESGVTAVKIYPAGVTNNSHGGMTEEFFENPKSCGVLDAIQENELVLCIHAEVPGCVPWEAEIEAISTIESILEDFPFIRIVVEHITTEAMVKFVLKKYVEGRRIAATITAHHLSLTIFDVMGDKFYPHKFCKPIAKSRKDLKAIRDAATSGMPCFFLGSDSAPHQKENKEGESCCAGVYSSPLLLEHVVEVFGSMGYLPKLNGFISQFGDEFYKKETTRKLIKVVYESWTVPKTLDGFVPYRAGETVKWKIIKSWIS